MRKFTRRVTKSLQVEFEVATDKEAFKVLASLDECFGITSCGKCKSEDIMFILRSNKKGHQFPEMKCRKCHYKLAFGQNLEGGSVFPRLRYHDKHPLVKDGTAKEGEYIGNSGWELFQSGGDE